MSRVTKRVGTKNREARIKSVREYYKRFRNGKNSHNKENNA